MIEWRLLIFGVCTAMLSHAMDRVAAWNRHRRGLPCSSRCCKLSTPADAGSEE